jgi:predicted small secreted protein
MKNFFRSTAVLCAVILLAVFGLSSCNNSDGLAGFGSSETSKLSARSEAYEPVPSEEEMGGDMEAESPAPAAVADALNTEGGSTTTAYSGEDSSQTEPEKETEKKRIYSGYAELEVADIEKTKRDISDLATGSGGYVEEAYDTTITIRVPAARFDELFEAVLANGRVLHKEVETVDVTEYFVDLESRLTIYETTRQRLYELLEETTDLEERLKILREIRRLTEEIEWITLTLDLLEERVAFSRITASLVSSLNRQTRIREEIPFPWIADLDPLYPSVPKAKGNPELDLGPAFAVFPKKQGFRAESPDGTRVRIGSRENNPAGDTAFWQEAVRFHLGPLYAEAEKKDFGTVKGVLFTGKDRKPYFYLVGILAEGKELYVLESFFPDKEAYDTHAETLFEAYKEFLP